MLLLTLCAVIGCVPSTVAELKREAPPLRLTTTENYQSVYKRLKAAVEDGTNGGFLLAENHVQSELYPDLGLGEISVRNNNMGDKSVFGYCVVEKKGAYTQITAYCDDGPTGRQICEIIEGRITGYRNCINAGRAGE